MPPDPKPEPRVENPAIFKELHFEWNECALCGSIGWEDSPMGRMWVGLSLHHLNKHPRDDLRGNLVMVCGHGTAGCHGRIEAHDPDTLAALGEHVREERPDAIEYLDWRLGGLESALEWLQRMFSAPSVAAA